MPVWRLEPIDLTSEHWATSTHKSVAIVRAPSEDIARQQATRAFGIMAVSRSAEALFSPWGQNNLVRCTRIERSEFREDGPATILEPPHFGDTPAASLA